jgi:HTH-type transcriptional regulator / antitoxin HigA
MADDIDDNCDPIDMLGYVIDELGHTQGELAEILHSRSRASDFSRAGARSR